MLSLDLNNGTNLARKDPKNDLNSEHTMGGVEKRGGRRTSPRTPLPKPGFGSPFVWYVFHPPSGVIALVFLCRGPRLSTPEAFLEGSNNLSGGCVVGVRFLPHTFPPPPPQYLGPVNRHRKLESQSLAA